MRLSVCLCSDDECCRFAIVLLSVFYEILFIRPLVIFVQIAVGMSVFSLLIISGLNLLLTQVWIITGELIVDMLPIELWTFIGSLFFVYLMTLMAGIYGKCFFWLDQKENPPKRHTSQKK